MAAITWNPADAGPNIVFSNGNLTLTAGNSTWEAARATISKNSGKWYWENLMNGVSIHVGIGTSDAGLTQIGNDVYGYSYYSGGRLMHGNSWTMGYPSYTTGDIIGVALDLDNGKMWFSKNNVWVMSGDPAAGTNENFSGISGEFFPANSVVYVSSGAVTAKFISDDQTYTPPTGFTSFLVPPLYSFSGYVLENGTPVSRVINLHNRSDGSLVTTTTTSGSTGYYYMETLSSGSHYIVCLDNAAGEDYNDLILGNVFPTTVSG